MFETLLRPEIQSFIRKHEQDDVSSLSLQKPPAEDWPYALIMNQIKARQKASRKIPDWLEIGGLILPKPDIIEQASSTATARYKASLVNGNIMLDLTAGAGVDSAAFTQNFQEIYSVEQDRELAKILTHNAPLLSSAKWHIMTSSAEEFVKAAPKADLVYIDPQRRTEQKKGLFRFEDCSPEILALLPILKEISSKVMVKASPMIDITKGLEELSLVSDVHVVEWNGQCREVLFLIDFEKNLNISDVPITAVSLKDQGTSLHQLTFTKDEENKATFPLSEPLKYLYEPYPAFLKAGGYNTMAKTYNLMKLHPQTHLYTSQEPNKAFPGRIFKIIDTYPAKAKKIPLQKANLAVRNFPVRAPELQKKLKLKDGGNDYLFACTLLKPQEERILIHGQKI